MRLHHLRSPVDFARTLACKAVSRAAPSRVAGLQGVGLTETAAPLRRTVHGYASRCVTAEVTAGAALTLLRTVTVCAGQ